LSNRTRRAVAIMTLLATASGLACASLNLGGSDGRAVEIRVQNNLTPPTSVSISLLPAAGARRFVGVVAPSEAKALQVDPPPESGAYRLLAEATDGSALASRQFALTEGRRIEWTLSTNSVREGRTP
jgi:hypothetical protein